ncbi:MYB DNA-binding domain protein [Talaromyces islandicus]|uniref:MYB DNA-binding domain protein n=1 Tax=Talaromyces islandicus TaxID=28573 RepID=A0A0U1LRF7_TALIS|nr:MYB DNA-binding domain protein [Talaromyces islandicus]
MGASSSQVQMDKENDTSAATAAATAAATTTAPAAAFENTITPKSTQKSLRTYSKRKRPASPESMARPLTLSTTQEQAGSAKRRRADKENGQDEDTTAALSGKENRDPDTTESSSEQDHEQKKDEPKSVKKQKVQQQQQQPPPPPPPLAAPPSPPPTQRQSGSIMPKQKAKKRPTEAEKTLQKKKSLRTLEGRLSLPEQTFQPGHVSEKNEKKTGWFSPEEIKTLEKYKADFCKENVIDGDTFDQCIQASHKDRVVFFKRNLSHMSYTEFWNSIYERLPNRDRRSIARFMRRHFQAGNKPYHWTEADDDELQRLHQIHGPKWSVVAAEMERTQDDVVQRWKNKVEHRHTMRRGGWSKEEVEKLIEVLERSRGFLATEKNVDVGRDIYEMDDKYVSWGAVSDFFGNTRSRQQCADKWRKIRGRVADARQTKGNQDATYLDVYDFSTLPRAPYGQKSRGDRRGGAQKLPKSSDYVYSDDEEEEENEEEKREQQEKEEEQEGDGDGENDAASDDDNTPVSGHLPLQQSSADDSNTNTNDENNNNNNNNQQDEQDQQEPDGDDDMPDAEPSITNNKTNNQNQNQQESPYNPATLQNILLPDHQPLSSSPSKKPKLSKAERAEAKAARKAERKAERKAARKAARKAERKAQRKEARRAQKRARLVDDNSSRSVSVKRESTQESSG